MSCLFCKINQQEIPADIIFEDDIVTAFHDITPQAPTHILIIPKKHIATLNDMGEGDREILGHMAFAAKSIASKLGFAENGYRTVMNCNSDGGQTVFHIHMHLLAGRGLSWPPG